MRRQIIQSASSIFKRDFSKTTRITSWAQSAVARINNMPAESFGWSNFNDEVVNLSEHLLKSQKSLAIFPFASDTGSPKIFEVLARQSWENENLKVHGYNPDFLRKQKAEIKSLFIDDSLNEEEKALKAGQMRVTLTSSTTQANKVGVTCISNINRNNGEVALASKHSHIFIFELGQPALSITPSDEVTGKLTVADLDKSLKQQIKNGKRVKLIHLDQPTNGDYFYSEEELKKITTWAHQRAIPVSMDIERLGNNLPVTGKDYYDFTTKCGVDIVSLGMQKTGGARSSANIVLDKTYIADPENLKQRTDSFLRAIGGVTDNRTFVIAGWEEMLKDKRYLENAKNANENSNQIAEFIKQFSFPVKKDSAAKDDIQEIVPLEMQNYPLTSNMIFTKFPREFLKMFNDAIAKSERTPDYAKELSLNIDRYGVTRIVSSYDVGKGEVEFFTTCLGMCYEQFCSERDIKPKANLKYSISEESVIDKEADLESEHLAIKKDGEAVFKALLKKASESISKQDPLNFTRKFTCEGDVPMLDEVLMKIFLENLKGYHKPYGNDEVSLESKTYLRQMFNTVSKDKEDKAIPVVFTASKAQAVTGVTQFVKFTEESVTLVSEGSYEEHYKHGRSVKGLELDGEYKRTDKLDPSSIGKILEFHNSDAGKHTPIVSAVMIQQPTSKGYIYTPEEISKITKESHRHHVPVIMQTIGFSYHLARENESYDKYTTECGVDIVTLGFSRLGGGLSSAIAVLDQTYLPSSANSATSLQTMLDRTVKENGGKQSDSATLAAGWKEMIEKDLWRESAQKANHNFDRMMNFLSQYKTRENPIEFENEKPAHNIISVKLSDDFWDIMNNKGYDFKVNEEGYVKCKVPYSLRDQDVVKFYSDFEQAHKEVCEKSKKPSTNIVTYTYDALVPRDLGKDNGI